MSIKTSTWHEPVAVGVSPAVEPGVSPGGITVVCRWAPKIPEPMSGRQDAGLYVRRDACRYGFGGATPRL
jgi:hypothetical protein